MEGGGIVQADQPAEIGKADAFAVPRDFFENRKCATQRLDAAALAIIGVIVDVALRGLYQPRDTGLA
jgi:hypothetical protein